MSIHSLGCFLIPINNNHHQHSYITKTANVTKEGEEAEDQQKLSPNNVRTILMVDDNPDITLTFKRHWKRKVRKVNNKIIFRVNDCF